MYDHSIVSYAAIIWIVTQRNATLFTNWEGVLRDR